MLNINSSISSIMQCPPYHSEGTVDSGPSYVCGKKNLGLVALDMSHSLNSLKGDI